MSDKTKICQHCSGNNVEIKDVETQFVQKHGFLYQAERLPLLIDNRKVCAYLCSNCGHVSLFAI